MSHEVTFIPGDGTGPELAEATRRVLEATGVEFTWDEHPAGEDVYREEGTPFPDRTLKSIKRTKVGIKGPTTTPVVSGFRSVNVLLRKELDLYSCIRPCKAYEGVRMRFAEADIVIVRENTEDLYAGIEFERDTLENVKLSGFLADELGSPVREHSGISIKPISEFGSGRIVRSAFDCARANARRKVTAAHKANIMKFSDGLFLEVARKVAKDYDDIEIPRVANRGAEIIDARGASSAASAANAAIDHVRDWVQGTAEGDWVSMAVASDGSYGVDEGLISSFPVRCANGQWEIVQGLDVPAFSRERIDRTVAELKHDRDAVQSLSPA